MNEETLIKLFIIYLFIYSPKSNLDSTYVAPICKKIIFNFAKAFLSNFRS